MKLIRYFSICVWWIFLLNLVGCGGSNNNPPPPQTNVFETTAAPNTGQLVIRVMGGPNFQPIENVDVSIYATFTDFQNDLYLSRFYTNRMGEVNAGFLNIGNYYIYASYRFSGQEFKRIEAAQIQEGKTLVRNIILY